MSYKEWFDKHALKHAAIMEKLHDKTQEQIIAYFDFENMKRHEEEFCPLYAKNIKCHEIKQLNCYLCACPNFRFDDKGFKEVEGKTLFSFCKSESVKGKECVGEGFIHQNCESCCVPHEKEYIKIHFDRDWKTIMKEVLPNC